MCKVDFIIVGQGLAGTVLALSLMSRSKSFKIIDDNSATASSFSAAGISHPLSFKRLILSWKAEKLIPISKEFYIKTSKIVNEVCFSDQEMLRLFSSFEEQNNWHRKSADITYNKFLKKSLFDFSEYKINDTYGHGKVNHAGRLNVSKYVKLFRKYFTDNNYLIKNNFNYTELLIDKNEVHYQNIIAKNIIFCEGPSIKNNPFFNYLPFGFNKGDIFKISSISLPEKLLSKGCFVLPIKKHEFIIGSTYNHKDLDLSNKKSGRKELIHKLSKLGVFNYKILTHKNGIRPSTIDRRPVIGEHPLIKNIFIFNGLGSRGVMLAPYYADQLLNAIIHDKKIDAEATVDRFSKVHLKKFNKL